MSTPTLASSSTAIDAEGRPMPVEPLILHDERDDDPAPDVHQPQVGEFQFWADREGERTQRHDRRGVGEAQGWPARGKPPNSSATSRTE